VAIVAQGKNDWAVRQAIEELGVEVVGQEDAQTLVIGTLSPGPMLDAAEEWAERDDRRVVLPWEPAADKLQAGAQQAA
jgi:hypothetical protein